MAATYVGPSLVDTFVQLIDSGGTAWEALRLILILIAGKTVQTLASHHYSFQCQLLEMRIRGALQAALYRKSVLLSTGGRRAHGAGAIVNYMQADATKVSSAVQGIHGLWMTPLQIVVALLLPYDRFGPALFMAFAVIVAVTVITRFSNNLILNYQTKFLRFRDDRIKATTEMLNHMRLVKLQAWEEMFGKKVRELRHNELGWLRKIMILRCANNVMFSCAPAAMGVLVFGTYLACRGQLDPGKVFTATAFFNTLAEPMTDYPQIILSSVQALVSLARLNEFLTDAEISRMEVERGDSAAAGALAVKVEGGVFAWDLPAGEAMVKDTSSEPQMEAVLKGIDLELRKGELAAVVGTVGSGKSSLLSCIMGDMHKVSGKISICGRIAFVAQTAWIQNGTIQENILFGKPLHRQRYSEAIRACCLEKDLEMMELGDSTEIGENGINLSAGQKQRIQLARAVYQDCDIYLLDDIFSAVDAHVGSTIFMRCLKGILKNKTILLATHQVDFLKSVDTIYVMKDGQVIQSGGYLVLLASCPYFSALAAAYHTSMEKAGEQYCQVRTTGSCQVTKSNKYTETTAVVLSKEAGSSELIQKEEKKSGRVSWRLYKLYMTEAYGWLGVLAFLVLSALPKGFSMSSNYWLSYNTSGDVIFNNFIFMVVYVSMLAAQIVFEGIRTFVMIFSGLLSAQAFFNKMFDSILRAPMSFFDITPSGRILSRASSDQEKIDFSLVFNAGTAVSLCISVLTIIVATCQAAWPSFILVLPLLLLNIRYQNLYMATSRELTRLQGVTEAPVIDHFKETFLGTQTVRCFEKEKEFYQTNLDKINSNLHMSFHNYAISEWLGFRMDLIGTVILSATAFLMVILPSNFISKELVGMSLSGGLSLNSMLLSTISIICMIENDMVASERVSQYCNLTSEARWEVPDSIPSPDWPRRGDITVENLKIRYRQNAPLILKGITISIKNGEKIGVVGRTGSGKTTLIQALFRLVEPTEGSIVIDGVDICTLGLHDLRSRFGMIPQEPALFEGTLRNNIDPAGLYSDAKIWQALNSCQLKDLVASKPEKLDTRVADMGNDWSLGQKQILCFCRVLLKRSQILFMDEATSCVDPQTDAIIHSIIRKKFANYTVISIAHRIPTVKDSNRVLVLDAGLVKEFDAPSNLMGRPSAFAAMVREYEIRSLSAQPSTG